MNTALLKKTSIRAGTPFCPVVAIGGIAHPNQLPTPSQFCFPTVSSAAEAARASKSARFPHLPTPNASSFVPTKPHPTNTSAIGGLFN